MANSSRLNEPSEPNADVDESPTLENKKQAEIKLNVPYKLSRARSLDSLDRFIASIEAAKFREQEEDVDKLMFGTPWTPKELA